MTGEKKGAKRLVILSALGVVALSLFTCLFAFIENSAIEKKHREENANRLLREANFHYIPKEYWPPLKVAVASLLKTCPRISEIATHRETLDVVYYPGTWWGGVRFMVQLVLTPESKAALPARLQKEVPPNFGLMGGEKPGLYIFRPVGLWLCNVPSQITMNEILTALIKQTKPLKDMMHFIPLKDVPPNSFEGNLFTQPPFGLHIVMKNSEGE